MKIITGIPKSEFPDVKLGDLFTVEEDGKLIIDCPAIAIYDDYFDLEIKQLQNS